MNDPVMLIDEASTAVVETIRAGVYPPGRRVQLQVAYCRLVLDHHFAIGELVKSQLLGSAFALARPTFEALVKGLWLFYCATDEQLERHAGGKELKQIKILFGDMSAKPIEPVVLSCLSLVKEKYWNTLSSLTHVGHAQLRNWINPDGVDQGYSDIAVQELANFASFMAVAAGRELALRAGNTEGASNLRSMLPETPRKGA